MLARPVSLICTSNQVMQGRSLKFCSATMSLVHLPKKLSSASWEETVSEGTIADESKFILVEEVSSLPPPSPRTRVDPRLEITVKMMEAVQERQDNIVPLLNKLPQLLEEEVEYTNRQLNHLANVQESSKKYLIILSGAVAIMTAMAGVKLVHTGVGFWKWFKTYTPTSAEKVEGTGVDGKESKPARRIRRSHQRDWRISEGWI